VNQSYKSGEIPLELGDSGKISILFNIFSIRFTDALLICIIAHKTLI